MAKKLDLERVLSKQGFGTRKQCRIMIVNAEITVNGELCDDPDAIFELENLTFTVLCNICAALGSDVATLTKGLPKLPR